MTVAPKASQRRRTKKRTRSRSRRRQHVLSEPRPLPPGQKCFVYVLENDAKTHTYVGFTVDLQKRIRQHNGEIVGGAKRTRKHRPWHFAMVLTASPTWFNQIRAQMLEWAIAKSSRLQKKAHMNNNCQPITQFRLKGRSALGKTFHNVRWTLHNRPKFTQGSVEFEPLDPEHEMQIFLSDVLWVNPLAKQSFAKLRYWKPKVFALDLEGDERLQKSTIEEK